MFPPPPNPSAVHHSGWVRGPDFVLRTGVTGVGRPRTVFHPGLLAQILRRCLDPPGTHPNHLRNGGGWSPRASLVPRSHSFNQSFPAGDRAWGGFRTEPGGVHALLPGCGTFRRKGHPPRRPWARGPRSKALAADTTRPSVLKS